MHRLLRRQLERHLGADASPPPEVRRLLRDVDAEYRRADDDRGALQRALELLSDLTRRLAAAAAPGPTARPRASPLPRLLRRTLAQAPFAAVICDPDLEVLAWNASAERMFGYPATEAIGRELADLLFSAPDRSAARRDVKAILARGELEQSLRLAATRSGDARLDEWTVVPLPERGGGLAGVAVLVREPYASSDRYAVAALASGDGVFDWDLKNDRLWLSDAWLALVGADAGTGAPADWLDRVHPADRDAVAAALRVHLDEQTPRFESEHRLRDRTGAWKWVLARGRATRDAAGKGIRLSGTVMDVTERRAAAERALNDALHDPLTRLPNRALFLDLVKRTFARRRRDEQSFAVVFLDLDRFKAVNDSLGHAAGDELLVEFAGRLQTCLREGDTLARQGGDEFTILLDDLKSPDDAIVVAERIHGVTAEAFQIGGHDVFSTASIGIALWAPSYGRPEDLLHDADTAMYRAKAQGRARTVFFDATMRERTPQLLDLEADLRRALIRHEFRVHYQPLIAVATGRIQGLEALIRWAHPKRGLIAPEQFVPFAEETGLIVPIGSWLLRQAGRDFQGCRRAVPSAGRLTLHVNVSSKQLHGGALLEQLDGLFHEVELDPQDLAVEVTEKTLQQSEDTTARLAAIRDRGVQLCMDNFGSGSASLSALHRLQLDSLKIDRSLFTGGLPRGKSPELIRTIISLARALGKPVVAEGVETAEQLGFLRELGCSAAQGFYFSPAVDSTAACSLLERAPTW
jgi:diguanylate cyclase (GGDEF)-like protein/PAS domain S-box-containing protein